jgi:hypothetical protein
VENQANLKVGSEPRDTLLWSYRKLHPPPAIDRQKHHFNDRHTELPPPSDVLIFNPITAKHIAI